MTTSVPEIPKDIFRRMRRICRSAWQKNMLAGFNGNISLRFGDEIYITRSGAAKGSLTAEDISIINLEGQPLRGLPPSSEAPMHLALYRSLPAAAIVHTHPRHMLALSLCVTEENFLNMPIFESSMLRARLGFAPALPPGGPELAQAVAKAAQNHDAIWMQAHGLVCHADSLRSALALSDELEHLAAVQLLMR